jgi:hypothetical protein
MAWLAVDLVGGGVVGEQPPGDRLGQGAVQAAVHGQDVLGGQPAGLAVSAAADGEVVVDGLDLQRGELLERPGPDGGSDVVAEQPHRSHEQPDPADDRSHSRAGMSQLAV